MTRKTVDMESEPLQPPCDPRSWRVLMKRRQLSAAIGLLIGVAGLGFVVITLARDWDQIVESLRSARWVLLVPAVVVGLLGMTTIGALWRHLITRLGGERVRLRSGMHHYFVGQLGKYVPGGIWPIVGRAEMAHRGGVSRSFAYTATLGSLAFTYLAALVLGAIGSLALIASDEAIPWWATLSVAAAPLGVAVMHPRILDRVLALARRISKRPLDVRTMPWTESITMIVAHLPAWIAISGATYLVSESLGGAMSFTQVLAATCLSWFLGFVIIGLPGGLGVREAVFVAMASSTDPALAAAIALLARLVFIAVDLLGAAITTLSATTGRPTPGPD